VANQRGMRQNGPMLRAFLRWSGYAALAAAMALGVFDGARGISISGLATTPLGDAALWLLPRHYPLLEQASMRIHPALWDPLLAWVFALPGVIVLFVLGGVLLWLGQRPAPPPVTQAAVDTDQRMRSPG
jgi:hypothetical protein